MRGDAVDDGVLVAGTAFDLQFHIRIQAGRLATDLRAVADLNRVRGIVADNAVILHENARHAVTGRRDEEGVVEAQLQRARLDVAIEIRLRLVAQPKVPFADHSRLVARGLEHGWDRDRAGFDKSGGVARSDAGSSLPPCVASRQECIAGGCADGGRRVGIGEAAALTGEAIKVGRFHLRSTMAADVAVSQVV